MHLFGTGVLSEAKALVSREEMPIGMTSLRNALVKHLLQAVLVSLGLLFVASVEILRTAYRVQPDAWQQAVQ
jgi:hypothetical protein